VILCGILLKGTGDTSRNLCKCCYGASDILEDDRDSISGCRICGFFGYSTRVLPTSSSSRSLNHSDPVPFCSDDYNNGWVVETPTRQLASGAVPFLPLIFSASKVPTVDTLRNCVGKAHELSRCKVYKYLEHQPAVNHPPQLLFVLYVILIFSILRWLCSSTPMLRRAMFFKSRNQSPFSQHLNLGRIWRFRQVTSQWPRKSRPILSLLYLFNGLDRGNVGNAETQG
jgi:hypothetical protein